jgi:Zn-dependent protease with chaperone function
MFQPVQWYAPLFAAYSFALRRTNEYEADRAAAQAAGPRSAADALINVEVMAAYLDESAPVLPTAPALAGAVPPFHGRVDPRARSHPSHMDRESPSPAN